MLLKQVFIKYRNLFKASAKASCAAEYLRRRLVMEQNILHLHESGIVDTKYCDMKLSYHLPLMASVFTMWLLPSRVLWNKQ